MANNIDDLLAANRILAREKVLDGYGHISVRDLIIQVSFISRSLAPELVTAGDIVVLDVASSSLVAGSGPLPVLLTLRGMEPFSPA